MIVFWKIDGLADLAEILEKTFSSKLRSELAFEKFCYIDILLILAHLCDGGHTDKNTQTNTDKDTDTETNTNKHKDQVDKRLTLARLGDMGWLWLVGSIKL